MGSAGILFKIKINHYITNSSFFVKINYAAPVFSVLFFVMMLALGFGSEV